MEGRERVADSGRRYVLISDTDFGYIGHYAGNGKEIDAGELGSARRKLNELLEEEAATRGRRRCGREANDSDVAREKATSRGDDVDGVDPREGGRHRFGSAARRRDEDMEGDAGALFQRRGGAEKIGGAESFRSRGRVVAMWRKIGASNASGFRR